jgi:MSHA biogenesis protein MshL
VFMAIVSDTRYSMLVHPEVTGNISLNLKDVTVFDALESIRDLYGYEYKVDGTRIYILPITMQTRIFQVNYLTGTRKGESQLRVTSGSVSDTPISGTPGGMPVTTTGPGVTSRPQDSSKINTSTSDNFWDDLTKALNAIVGNEKGRSVVVSPMSGVIVVRAMPSELKNVAAYLRAAQLSVERQVILEAKIIEVQLSTSFQSGVNWAAFRNGNSKLSGGQLGPGTTLSPSTGGVPTPLSGSLVSGTPGASIAAGAANATTGATNPGTLFGLVFQNSNFAALLNFLETEGDVHVLSSPRIATLNDQKAILKVGTDEFFVTNVTSTTTVGTATTTTPSVTLQPFFSGIALDVTPSIDANNDIILHIHPSVSEVTTVNKTVNAGAGGTLNLPLASSSVSETDSIVRVHNGQIVAIGGLMKQSTADNRSGLPWLPKGLFGQTSASVQKSELVILLKATVVDSNKDWSDDIARSRDRVNSIGP